MTHTTDSGTCVSGPDCRNQHPTGGPATVTHTPLCDSCLTRARLDIAALVYDYLDLAQLQSPTLSQAPHPTPGRHGEPALPIKTAPEALQAEIVHALTTWEGELHAHTGQPDPNPHVRPGAAVQRATHTITRHLERLARLGPTAVYPTGCEDEPCDMAGWQAIHHLQALHRRARGMLGRTHRTRILPGPCPHCATGELRQDEPRYRGDPCDVYCTGCHTHMPHTTYEAWVATALLTKAGARP